MPIFRALTFLIALLVLAGCAALPDRYQLRAADLSDLPAGMKPGHDAVFWILEDSQEKCSKFVNSMFAETAGSGFILDTLSTATSALATVFTATAVTHALSASSAVFSGAKASISSNYLNTLAISHIAQAIQATYYTDIQKYIAYLRTLSPDSVDYYAERSQIQSYHDECSLASAEGSLASSVAPAPPLPATPFTFTYTLTKSLLLKDVPSDFAIQFNVSSFKAAGVMASPTMGVPNQLSLQMSTPLTFNISPKPGPPDLTATINNAVTPPTLTFSGTPTVKDTITITGVPPATPPPAGSAGRNVNTPTQ